MANIAFQGNQEYHLPHMAIQTIKWGEVHNISQYVTGSITLFDESIGGWLEGNEAGQGESQWKIRKFYLCDRNTSSCLLHFENRNSVKVM